MNNINQTKRFDYTHNHVPRLTLLAHPFFYRSLIYIPAPEGVDITAMYAETNKFKSFFFALFFRMLPTVVL